MSLLIRLELLKFNGIFATYRCTTTSFLHIAWLLKHMKLNICSLSTAKKIRGTQHQFLAQTTRKLKTRKPASSRVQEADEAGAPLAFPLSFF